MPKILNSVKDRLNISSMPEGVSLREIVGVTFLGEGFSGDEYFAMGGSFLESLTGCIFRGRGQSKHFCL